MPALAEAIVSAGPKVEAAHLDVVFGHTADGTPVKLFGCHGGDNQYWQLELTSSPQRIRGIGGKCLVPGPVDGEATLEDGRRAWLLRALDRVVVLDTGEHCPHHIRARKP